jgi:hypothetical protein
LLINQEERKLSVITHKTNANFSSQIREIKWGMDRKEGLLLYRKCYKPFI